MKILKRKFNLETPFNVRYILKKKKNGFYIKLEKLENNLITESEEIFAGVSRAKAVTYHKQLFNFNVTPVHLKAVYEDWILKN